MHLSNVVEKVVKCLIELVFGRQIIWLTAYPMRTFIKTLCAEVKSMLFSKREPPKRNNIDEAINRATEICNVRFSFSTLGDGK